MTQLSPDERRALLERFRRWVRDQRLPLTRQREAIAEVVLLGEEHVSAAAIARRLRERGERAGTATIYRTLDMLQRAGVIRTHEFGAGFRRFEPTDTRGHHEHLICLRCGRVEEFQNEHLTRMLPLIADELGFRPERHRVELYGTCRACLRGGAPARP